MSRSLALQRSARATLSDREAQLLSRERELIALTRDLQQLQSRYLQEVGPLYDKLTALEAEIAAAEVRAGLRVESIDSADAADEPGSSEDGSFAGASCSNRAAPSDGLKKMFRDLAKAIHPDLALDEPARCRRHSLMAEANRAYAERDEDRLRLILQVWERSPEAVVGEGPDADARRLERRAAEVEERLAAVEGEFSDLSRSAIYRLRERIAEARQQGWDLFAEMLLQVKREIRTATARLASLRRERPRV